MRRAWNIIYEMSNHDKVIYTLFGFAAIIASILFLSGVDGSNVAKYDECVSIANEAGIDPNDDERSEFIKNCYEN
jgi:hypothetical protein